MNIQNRPSSTTKAIKLLYLCLIFGTIITIYGMIAIHHMPNIVGHTAAGLGGMRLIINSIAIVVSVLIQYWLIRKISVKRNWARITYLIFMILGFLTFVSAYLLAFTMNVNPLTGQGMIIHTVLGIIFYAITLYAIFLLFTRESNAWFKS